MLTGSSAPMPGLTLEQKYSELLAGDRCRLTVARSLGVRRGSRSGSRAGGPVGLPGVEEEMVSDAVRLAQRRSPRTP